MTWRKVSAGLPAQSWYLVLGSVGGRVLHTPRVAVSMISRKSGPAGSVLAGWHARSIWEQIYLIDEGEGDPFRSTLTFGSVAVSIGLGNRAARTVGIHFLDKESR